MAELAFLYGPMGCGKSTFALQTAYNGRRSGRRVLLFSKLDRDGPNVTSRMGVSCPATLVDDQTDFVRVVQDEMLVGRPVDLLVCDEAQFYSRGQVGQLAQVVDQFGVDVLCVGLLTDFRTVMFDGTARLVELSDRVERLQVQALCWCGETATMNARVVDGRMVRDGEQVVVGDIDSGRVSYEVLCRPHYREGVTSSDANVCHLPATATT